MENARDNIPEGGTSTQMPAVSKRDFELDRMISENLNTFGKPNIDVEVHDGLVKLRGSVRTFRQKERLHRFVMGLPGVRALKDLLRVRPLETVGDRQIALHIRQALDAHAELPLGTATVHVRGGIATLSGHVRSAEECFLAENVANHCRGVTKIMNELTVDPLDEISDEAAARAVRGALAYCEEFATEGVTVDCADGEVCLRGQVPTMLDRTLVEELARLQTGVRSVENHIQVCSETPALNGSEKKSAPKKSSRKSGD